MEAYRLWLQCQDYTPATVAGYVRVVTRWQRWCEVQGIEHEHVEHREIMLWLGQKPLAQSTIHNIIVSLRIYYRYLVGLEVRPDDPTLTFRLPKPSLPPVQPYTDQELRRLLAVALRPKDAALLLILIDTGVRASELAAIREEDIDWKAGTIRIYGKGRKWRLVAPGKKAMVALKDYLESRPPNIWGVQGYWGVRMWFARLSEKAGVNGNLHRFRHNFACDFARKGGGDVNLKMLLGHTTFQMVERYTAAVRQETALEAQREHSIGDSL